MNRLTKRNSNGVAYMSIAETLAKWEQEIEGSQAILEGVYAIFQKLAEYEDTGLEPEEVYKTIKAGVPEWIPKYLEYRDLEKQGRLIKLPCKVGDTVYHIFTGKIIEDRVIRITLNKDINEIDLRLYGYIALNSIGKTVFLTREEAEKALEKSLQ